MTPAEQLAQGQLTLGFALEVVLKLGLVVVLIYISLRLLRQAPLRLPGWPGAPTDPGPLRVIQVQPLNRMTSLYLIEVPDRQLLVSVQANQVQMLSEWPLPPHTPPLETP
ncbi:MAG: flagellar biosynthetic protein FliO [Candidatus Sericytochromatia bacterium]